jgi:hypothetical protein
MATYGDLYKKALAERKAAESKPKKIIKKITAPKKVIKEEEE